MTVTYDGDYWGRVTLPQGRELDAQVALKVLGWSRAEAMPPRFVYPPDRVALQLPPEWGGVDDQNRTRPLPFYSFRDDMSAAWCVVEKMLKTPAAYFDITNGSREHEGKWIAYFRGWGVDGDKWRGEGIAEDPAHAICLAALGGLEAYEEDIRVWTELTGKPPLRSI